MVSVKLSFPGYSHIDRRSTSSPFFKTYTVVLCAIHVKPIVCKTVKKQHQQVCITLLKGYFICATY
jgi:hypothetical protein